MPQKSLWTRAPLSTSLPGFLLNFSRRGFHKKGFYVLQKIEFCRHYLTLDLSHWDQ